MGACEPPGALAPKRYIDTLSIARPISEHALAVSLVMDRLGRQGFRAPGNRLRHASNGSNARGAPKRQTRARNNLPAQPPVRRRPGGAPEEARSEEGEERGGGPHSPQPPHRGDRLASADSSVQYSSPSLSPYHHLEPGLWKALWHPEGFPP